MTRSCLNARHGAVRIIAPPARLGTPSITIHNRLGRLVMVVMVVMDVVMDGAPGSTGEERA